MKKLFVLQIMIAALAVFGVLYTIYRLFSYNGNAVLTILPLWMSVIIWLVLLIILIIIYLFIKNKGD